MFLHVFFLYIVVSIEIAFAGFKFRVFLLVFFFLWCEAFSYDVKHGKQCFLETTKFEVFEFKQCYEFSINVAYPPVSQNVLKQIMFWIFEFQLIVFENICHT